MSMTGEFELGHAIYRWSIEVPKQDERQITGKFSFQGCECDLNLDHSGTSYQLKIYCYEIPPKAFDVNVYLGYGRNFISYPKKTVESIRYTGLWESDISEIPKVLKDFKQHKVLHFKIILHGSEPSLEQEKTENKSVQTSPYLDVSPCMESLSQDLSRLFNAQESFQHSVELKCGDHTLLAHRSILSCRSEVLSAMLKSDMVEGRSGLVNIQDMDLAAFQDFVRYLYTGKLPGLTMNKAKELYEAADKYAVKSLMKRCADYLIENLTLENFCECVALADAHSDQFLKEAIMSYISEKKVPVDGEHWIAFCKSHPLLALEILNRSYKLHCPQ